jgi:hypothetical protein
MMMLSRTILTMNQPPTTIGIINDRGMLLPGPAAPCPPQRP